MYVPRHLHMICILICSFLARFRPATFWYQKASLLGSGLATQWIASSLLTGSSQNVITAYSTLKRAQHLSESTCSLSVPSRLYISALSDAVVNAFSSVKEIDNAYAGKTEPTLNADCLLNLGNDQILRSSSAAFLYSWD